MVLALSAHHIEMLQAHVEQCYPEEGCGLLLGRLQAGNSSESKQLAQVWPTDNVWQPEPEVGEADSDRLDHSDFTKARRYWIAAETLFTVQRYARTANLDIIGIYHSHPDHPAVPSECDRRYAWPQYSYIIVSVQQGKAVDLRSWCLDDTHQFQPEVISLLPP